MALGSERKIIIDTDPGCDDALAILMILQARNISVELITTVAGNAPIQEVTNNARYILNVARDRATRICSGSGGPLYGRLRPANVHGKTGLEGVNVLGNEELSGDAVDEIIRVIRRHPNQIDVLVLGPQTNIAKAIMKDPSTMQMVRELIIMGGAFNVAGNTSVGGEFNIVSDPVAASIVANFGIKKTYIPLDACNKVQIPISRIESMGVPNIKDFLLSILVPYDNKINELDLITSGIVAYDALAACYVIDGTVLQGEYGNVIIDEYGSTTIAAEDYGTTKVMFEPNIQKCIDLMIATADSA